MHAEELLIMTIIIIIIIVSKPSNLAPLLARLSVLSGYVILPVLCFS